MLPLLTLFKITVMFRYAMLVWYISETLHLETSDLCSIQDYWYYSQASPSHNFGLLWLILLLYSCNTAQENVPAMFYTIIIRPLIDLIVTKKLPKIKLIPNVLTAVIFYVSKCFLPRKLMIFFERLLGVVSFSVQIELDPDVFYLWDGKDVVFYTIRFNEV